MAKRIKVKRPYFEPDKAHKIVGDAIQRMAAEERQAWSSTIEKPGLHVRKSPDWQGNAGYAIVRAVGIDEGKGMCIQVFRDLAGISKLSDFELSQSQFQRIEE